jgi:hypothetical protein
MGTNLLYTPGRAVENEPAAGDICMHTDLISPKMATGGLMGKSAEWGIINKIQDTRYKLITKHGQAQQ